MNDYITNDYAACKLLEAVFLNTVDRIDGSDSLVYLDEILEWASSDDPLFEMYCMVFDLDEAKVRQGYNRLASHQIHWVKSGNYVKERIFKAAIQDQQKRRQIYPEETQTIKDKIKELKQALKELK